MRPLKKTAGEKDKVVREKGEELWLGVFALILHSLYSNLHGINPPQGEQGRKRNEEDQVLNLAKGGVMLRVRRPSI